MVATLAATAATAKEPAARAPGLRICRAVAEPTQPPAAAPRPLRLAIVRDEPGSCNPPCRAGFICRAGRCVSLCNPACPADQRCVQGECEPLPRRGEPTRHSYLALVGGFRAGLTDPAADLGDMRLEIGGRYVSFQLGGGFGDAIVALRGAVVGHVPLQVTPKLPLFIIPTLGLGYSFAWVDDLEKTRQQDFFVVPGARLRYDLFKRLALFADLIQLEINFLRLQSAKDVEVKRQAVVPLQWGLHAGIAWLY